MKQKEIAEHLGMSQSAISYIGSQIKEFDILRPSTKNVLILKGLSGLIQEFELNVVDCLYNDKEIKLKGKERYKELKTASDFCGLNLSFKLNDGE